MGTAVISLPGASFSRASLAAADTGMVWETWVVDRYAQACMRMQLYTCTSKRIPQSLGNHPAESQKPSVIYTAAHHLRGGSHTPQLCHVLQKDEE